MGLAFERFANPFHVDFDFRQQHPLVIDFQFRAILTTYDFLDRGRQRAGSTVLSGRLAFEPAQAGTVATVSPPPHAQGGRRDRANQPAGVLDHPPIEFFRLPVHDFSLSITLPQVKPMAMQPRVSCLCAPVPSDQLSLPASNTVARQ